MVAQFFQGYASLEVTQPREVAIDLTFLTGLDSFDQLLRNEVLKSENF
jgi:hypothetical protein